MSHFKAVSLSFKNTPIEIREFFTFNEQSCKALLLSLKERFDISEALVISTCNRTEVYYSLPYNVNEDIIDFLVNNTPLSSQKNLKNYFRQISDNLEAVQYLFEVSVGLHSQVVGDLQISGQAKNAYQWSADVDMAGPFLHRLMHAIFYTNKKIVQETSYRDGAASISYAATELVDELVNGNKNTKILLVGAGELGEDATKNLISFGYKYLAICNRTKNSAIELANKLGDIITQIIPFENLFEEIQNFDVIISAVQVTDPLFTYERLKSINILSHKYFIDLAVPRSMEQSVETINGILLFNIEDLNKKTSKALQKRLDAMPHVNEIIGKSVEEFANWSREVEVSPTIQLMKKSLETIRLEELSRYSKQIGEEDLKMIDTITKNILQKIIKLPVVQLKAACKRGESENLIEALHELFDLEKTKELH